MGFPEMIFLFLLALLIFGPKKLPEVGKQIGRALNEFKRASNEFKSQIENEIAQLDRETEPQILPPSEPPVGAIAALSVGPEPVSETAALPPASEPVIEPAVLAVGHEPAAEAASATKAPDA